MNSSAGFKKRNLLRPPSAVGTNSKQFLKSVDISQSQLILASNIKAELSGIYESINLLDSDKKIRGGENSLQKGYSAIMKKWLGSIQNTNQKQDDDLRILKHMCVNGYEAGFKKLWKIVSNLDLMVTKITELQMISFLKYDEMFNQVAEDTQSSSRMLEKISKTGFSLSSFNLAQLMNERYQELFAVITNQRRKACQKSQNSSRGFLRMKNKENTDKSQIQKLKEENDRLHLLLKKQQQQKKPQISLINETNNPQTIFHQLQAKYKEQLEGLDQKIIDLKRQICDLKVKNNAIEIQNRTREQFSIQKPNGKQTEYEEALLGEINRMKAGFEKKISNIIESYSFQEREMRKRQNELKSQCERNKWERGLLLKKFEFLSSP